MNEIDKPANSLESVKFRQSIMQAQHDMVEMIAQGQLRDVSGECILTHYFTPIQPEFGNGCVYGRQIFLPQGSLVIGKLHRESHLNLILMGKVSVMTEFGKKYFEAPCVFVSEKGLKRAVYAEESTIWVTIHLTHYNKEEDLDKIEQEVIAKSYNEIGLLDSTEKLNYITNIKSETNL